MRVAHSETQPDMSDSFNSASSLEHDLITKSPSFVKKQPVLTSWEGMNLLSEVGRAVKELDKEYMESVLVLGTLEIMTGEDQRFVDVVCQVRQWGVSNCCGVWIPLHTGWNIPLLESLLVHDHDKEIADWLQFGWLINISPHVTGLSQTKYTHSRATAIPELLEVYLEKEKAHGTLMGLVHEHPFGELAALSLLNTQPHPGEPDRPRVILGLSFSPQKSVNDKISMDTSLGEEFELTYPTVDNLVGRTVAIGSSCCLFKCDLSHYFHQIPVNPADVPFLGFVWKDKLYSSQVFLMGL